MSSIFNFHSHASRPKAPPAAVLCTFVFLLIALGAPMFTFLYYLPNHAASQAANQYTVIQLDEQEAQPGDGQTVEVRVFDGVLEWFNAGKWTPYARLDVLRAGDPVAAAQQKVPLDGSERGAGALPLLPMRGEVKQAQQHSERGDDITPGDGSDTDANDLF